MVDKGDGLNNLTNKNTNEYKTFKTGGCDNHKIDADALSTFTWVTDVDPMIVVIEQSFAKYENQLMNMPLDEFPVAEIDDYKSEFVPIFKIQSGITADTQIDASPDNVTHQTMRFRDQFAGHTNDIESYVDPTRKLQDKDDVPLADFFSRPVKVFESQWNTNGVLSADFNPWRQFLTNKRVQNRLANFKLLRCDLRMKVVVNGNGFQYGRAIVAYWPMAGFDQLSTHAALVPADLVQTSQLPHIFVDPTTSTGGDMKIPFFWHENYFDITRSNWGGDLGLPDAGRVLFRTLNPLKHANGADDKVTISFFIWAENVQLAIPTSVDSATLVPQSGQEIDEANTKGMISGPATTVSKFAGIAAGYAPIAPYAMATSKIAGAVASAAKIMGYSRPANTKNPEPFRPTPISQLATTTTPDTALKMTVDDKQELTIDPRVSGVGSHDPLVIRDIAKREAYLTQFNWPVGEGPTSLLWNARVNPCLWQEENGAIVLPPCAIAAMPFRYWNGSMKFRFQVVCSTFHKGRLEIRFDPSFVDATTESEYNINYIEIIDIAETQDFTIEVTNSQPYSLLRHLDPGLDSATEGYSTTNYASSLVGLCNGVISVRVLNELTIPNSTINNDISVNVFISAGDDFEVFVPEDNFQKFTFFPTQSGAEVVPESQNTSEPSAPQQAESDHMGADLQYSSELNMVFAGESILSFRPLLKRYNLWRREPNSLLGNQDFWKITRQRLAFPFLRQGANIDYVEGAPNQGYNFANTVLLHWITMCFAGYRGSIRYKYLYTKSAGCEGETSKCCDDIGSRIYVERLDPLTQSNPAYVNFEETMVTTPAWLVSQSVIPGFSDRVPTGTRGSVYATDLINPNVEFEVPYQTQYRFVPGKLARMTASFNPTLQAGTYQNLYRVSFEGHTSVEQQIDMHVAAGEDFQVYFWSGMPRIYYQDAPPQEPPPETP